MNLRHTTGKIIVPKKSMIKSHEYAVGQILATTGYDVEFLLPRRTHTADIRFRGLEWEIKSPIGKSNRTIENNLRNALKQSPNIIIDLSRIRQPEQKCLREIKRQFKITHSLKRLIIITKGREIIEL